MLFSNFIHGALQKKCTLPSGLSGVENILFCTKKIKIRRKERAKKRSKESEIELGNK